MKMTQQNTNQIKDAVRKKYAQISEQKEAGQDVACCEPTGCCETVDYSVFAEDYSSIEGYNADADLGLGCGLPTEFAKLKPGDTVVDLGSGAGNDCFVARQIVGETGYVIGIDMTEEMVDKARKNASKLNFGNVEFLSGDIEEIPLDNDVADVVVSNCVFNLVPDKTKAFQETLRILKPGGHFSISDVVTAGDLPDKIRNDAEMYAGCVAGAIDKEEYLSIIRESGFENISVQKLKEINLPDEILLNYMTQKEAEEFKTSGTGIYSITVYADKSN